MGIPMNYGHCDGGPWHAKDLAHHEPSYTVPIEQHSKKVHVGVRRGTPGFAFGSYFFDESIRMWVWMPPSATPKRVDNKTA